MYLYAFLISVTVLISYVQGNCGPCPEVPKHYEELGCKGVFAEGGGCCPERFECPDLSAYDNTKCHLKGKSYDKGEDLLEGAGPPCSAACKCIGFGKETPQFNCANIECPDLFRAPDADCVQQYSLDKCCSVSSVCGEANVAQLHKCHYRGQEYHKGQRIYPNNAPCYSCICDEEFDNSTLIKLNANCKKIDCGIELRNLDRLQKGCVPVYFGEDSCCPIQFRCPKTTDEVVPIEGRSEIIDDPDMICKYNELTLRRGEMLNSDEKCIECSCKTPPMVNCHRRPNC